MNLLLDSAIYVVYTPCNLLKVGKYFWLKIANEILYYNAFYRILSLQILVNK